MNRPGKFSLCAATKILLLSCLLLSKPSDAKDLCQEYRNYTPLPEWFADRCNGDGSSKGNLGGAFSSLGDAFNLNPASIPTMKIPLGAEYIHSFSSSGSKNNFAFIKGFGHVGGAITTNSDETFYGNSVFQAPGASVPTTLPTTLPTTATDMTNGANSLQSSIFPTLNIGSAIELGDFLTKAKNSAIELIPTLGAMLKYNKTTGAVTPGFGLGWQIWKFSLGYSFTQDPANGVSPEISYSTVTVGLKTSVLQAEFVAITSRTVPGWVLTQNPDGTSVYVLDDKGVRPAYFFTLSTHLGNLILAGAVRSYQDVNSQDQFQYHFAAEYLVTSKIALEYLNNYVLDYQSLGIQVLF
jgi:hypothetical protein